MNEPTVRQALEMFVGLDRDEMLKIATWIIMVSVDLTQARRYKEHDQTNLDGLEAFPEGESIAPPSLLNMLSQVVANIFALVQKGN